MTDKPFYYGCYNTAKRQARDELVNYGLCAVIFMAMGSILTIAWM